MGEYKVLNHAFGYSKFAKHTVLLAPERGLLPDDKLTLLCCITIPGKCIVSSGQETAPAPAPEMPQPTTLGTHLSQLLASPEVPIPTVRAQSESEVFKVLKSGKTRRKGWKR